MKKLIRMYIRMMNLVKMYLTCLKYVRQNENNINICKSCGEMLNIGKYVYEGTYVKELDTFLTTSLAVGQDLNKIPKYAKYNRTIKNIEKNIEKFAFIINSTII